MTYFSLVYLFLEHVGTYDKYVSRGRSPSQKMGVRIGIRAVVCSAEQLMRHPLTWLMVNEIPSHLPAGYLPAVSLLTLSMLPS